MKRQQISAIAFYSLLVLSSLVFLGCEVGSSDSAVRNLDFNVTGLYRNTDTNSNSGKLVSNNSGSPITQLDLRQTGDQLNANDNNGKIFTGTIGDSGNFTMTGLTTAGKEGTMTGTIEASSGTGKMRGTWIEDTIYGTIFGDATVASNSGSSGGGSVSIFPGSTTVSSNGATQVFSASGGGGTFSWSLSAPSRGSLSSTIGPSVTYTRIITGENTITVTDAGNPGNKSSATITQP